MNAGNTALTGSPHRWKPWLLDAIIIAILVGDMVVFGAVTGKPLDMAPSALLDKPSLHGTPVQAGVAGDQAASGLLSPSFTLERTVSEGSTQYAVQGFGRRDGTLYVQVRLQESVDLSLEKGWGKAFQLLDDRGKRHFYDSHNLPNAVEVHDTFVDLPNDLHARQTVWEGTHRDLRLAFPDFPAARLPVGLNLVEAFQGNSPANPGHVFAQASFRRTGEKVALPAVEAMKPRRREFVGNAAPMAQLPGGVTARVRSLDADGSYLFRIKLEFGGPQDAAVSIQDAVLVDGSGTAYQLLRLEPLPAFRLADKVFLTVLVFEKLPVGASGLWLRLAGLAGGELFAKTLALPEGNL